jgi:hypothetical protein
VHLDPCRPMHCGGCAMADCPSVRTADRRSFRRPEPDRTGPGLIYFARLRLAARACGACGLGSGRPSPRLVAGGAFAR